jgi:energy-coupling factor transport system permease protein
MESRCYRGGANRTRVNALKFSAADYVVIGVTMAVLAGVIALRFV